MKGQPKGTKDSAVDRVPAQQNDSLTTRELFGVWSDLDWDEVREALHRMRHEVPPSAPLELPD